MDQTYLFIEEAEKLLNEVEAGVGEEEAVKGEVQSITVPIEIVNQTGVDIYALALSPANDEDWGENLITEVIADGESVEGELVFTADTLVWDILIQDSEENQLTFMGVDFTEASVDGSRNPLSENNGEYYAEVTK